jgi:hypothetical protein
MAAVDKFIKGRKLKPKNKLLFWKLISDVNYSSFLNEGKKVFPLLGYFNLKLSKKSNLFTMKFHLINVSVFC